MPGGCWARRGLTCRSPAGGSALPTALLLSALLGLALALGLCRARRAGLHKRLCQLGKGTSCQYRYRGQGGTWGAHWGYVLGTWV